MSSIKRFENCSAKSAAPAESASQRRRRASQCPEVPLCILESYRSRVSYCEFASTYARPLRTCPAHNFRFGGVIFYLVRLLLSPSLRHYPQSALIAKLQQTAKKQSNQAKCLSAVIDSLSGSIHSWVTPFS